MQISPCWLNMLVKTSNFHVQGMDQYQSTVKQNWDGGTVMNVKNFYPCLGSSHSGYEGDKINLVKIRVKK